MSALLSVDSGNLNLRYQLVLRKHRTLSVQKKNFGFHNSPAVLMLLVIILFEKHGISVCIYRVVYKSHWLAKFAGFSARFRRLLSLLHESKYVEEMDLQPSTFHKTPAT